MTSRRVVLSLSALLAGCSDNNITISATMVMQTFGSHDAGADAGDDGSGATQGQTSGTGGIGVETTGGSSSETSADPPASSSGETSGDASTSTGETTGGGPGETSSDPDTTSGGPLVPPQYVVLNHCLNNSFLVANLANEWATTQKKQPGASGSLGVGVSDSHVYAYAKDDNFLSRFGFESQAWEPFVAGPVAITHTNGWVEWVGGEKVCMGFFGRQEVHCHDGAKWRKISLTIQSDVLATWDAGANELYVKPYGTNGFQVIDLDADAIVRTIVGEPGQKDIFRCTYDYHDGYVYMDNYPNPARVDAQTGSTVALPIPATADRAGGVHPTENALYILTDVEMQLEDTLQTYDLNTKKLTLLPIEPPVGTAFRLIFQAPTGG